MFLQLAVGVVDGLEQIGEAGRLIHRPKPRKAMTQQLYVALGEQSNGHDPFVRHAFPVLICIRFNVGRCLGVPTVTPMDRMNSVS